MVCENPRALVFHSHADAIGSGSSADSIGRSLKAVSSWVESQAYKGYEPADGNASPLRSATFGNTFLQRLLQQAVLRAPVNIRPLLGIRPAESTKARGYMAAGYIEMYRQTGAPDYKEKAQLCLDWLTGNKSPGYVDHSWGNHYPYATRSGRLPRLEPIIVWTALNGFAFLDAFEEFAEPRYLAVAKSVCDWILKLPRELTPAGLCLSYHAFQQTSIHNSNMLGAAMLARTARLSNSSQGVDIAGEAMAYSCFHQHPDGSWFYGEEPNKHWIDNFHSGYNLESLDTYIKATDDRRFQDNLERGYLFFKDNFFESDGRSKYYHDRTYPIDIQCCAQAIETFVTFADRDADALPMARRVADWTIANMQDPDGHFYYRDLGWIRVKTPLMHWGQGTMFKALVRLWIELDSAAAPAASVSATVPAA